MDVLWPQMVGLQGLAINSLNFVRGISRRVSLNAISVFKHARIGQGDHFELQNNSTNGSGFDTLTTPI